MKKYVIQFAGWLKLRLEKFLQTENQRQAAKILEALRKQRQKIQLQAQASCSHVAGGNPLSEQPDVAGRTSIVWHGLHTGEQIGICTNCQKQWFPSDPDYAEWRRKASFNKMSAGGQRGRGDLAEPFLVRSLDLGPAPVSLPLFFAKQDKNTDIDPWLLDKNGNLDKFCLVDYPICERDEEEANDVQSA